MPENEEPTTAFDPLAVSVHSMDSGLDPEKDPTETPPVQSAEAEVEESEKESETEAEESPADGEEDDESGDEYSALKNGLAAPDLPEALRGDPEHEKRHAEYLYGIEKTVSKVQADLTTLQPYMPFAKGLSDPTTVRAEVPKFLEFLEKETGVALRDLVGSPQPETGENAEAWKEWRDDWEERGLTKADFDEALSNNYKPDYPGEYKAFKDASARFESKFGVIDKERAESQAFKAHQDFVDQEFKRVSGFLAKTENGWSVTRDMVSQAVKEFPHLKDDLVQAVKKAFPDELANHKVQAVLAAQGKEGPELLSKGSSAAKGAVLHFIDPDAPSSADVHKIAENLAALSK